MEPTWRVKVPKISNPLAFMAGSQIYRGDGGEGAAVCHFPTSSAASLSPSSLSPAGASRSLPPGDDNVYLSRRTILQAHPGPPPLEQLRVGKCPQPDPDIQRSKKERSGRRLREARRAEAQSPRPSWASARAVSLPGCHSLSSPQKQGWPLIAETGLTVPKGPLPGRAPAVWLPLSSWSQLRSCLFREARPLVPS